MRLNQAISAVTTEGAAAIREIKIHGATEGHEKDMSGKLARYTNIQTKFTVLSRMPSHITEFVVIVIVGLLLTYVHLTRGADVKDAIPLLGFFIIVSQRLITYLSFILIDIDHVTTHSHVNSPFFESLNTGPNQIDMLIAIHNILHNFHC